MPPSMRTNVDGSGTAEIAGDSDGSAIEVAGDPGSVESIAAKGLSNEELDDEQITGRKRD